MQRIAGWLMLAFILLSTVAAAAVLVFSPNGSYTTKLTIPAAVSALDASGKTVLVATPQTITTTVVWPTDRVLEIVQGGSISFSGSGSLSLPNGPVFRVPTRLLPGFKSTPWQPRVEQFGNVSTSRGRTFTQLSTAKQALGSYPATLRFSTPQGASTITIPSTVELIPENGALITLQTGRVLTYLGPANRWPRVPVFTGSGAAVFSQSADTWAVWGGGVADLLSGTRSAGRFVTYSTSFQQYRPAFASYTAVYNRGGYVGEDISAYINSVLHLKVPSGNYIVEVEMQGGNTGPRYVSLYAVVNGRAKYLANNISIYSEAVFAGAPKFAFRNITSISVQPVFDNLYAGFNICRLTIYRTP